MKKRLLSTLLFVVMVMTLLPASAFALEDETRTIEAVKDENVLDTVTEDTEDKEEPQTETSVRVKSASKSVQSRIGTEDDPSDEQYKAELTEVLFYADAEQARDKYKKEYAKLKASSSVSMTDENDSVEAIKDKTLIISYEHLNPNKDYKLMLFYGKNENDELKYSELCNLSIAEQMKGEKRTERSFLFAYTFSNELWESVRGNNYAFTIAICETKSDQNYEIAENSPSQKSMQLVKTTVDLGVIDPHNSNAVPADAIQTDDAEAPFYTLEEEDVKRLNTVTFFVDQQMLPENPKQVNHKDNAAEAADLIQKFIQFSDSYEERYTGNAGEWSYSYSNEGESVPSVDFTWRLKLLPNSIQSIKEDEALLQKYSAFASADGTVMLASLDSKTKNYIYIKAEGVPKRFGSYDGKGNQTGGYWIGFTITAPEGASQVAYSNDDSLLDDPRPISIERNAKIKFYINRKSPKPNFCVQFYNDAGVALTVPYKFNVKSSDVKLNNAIATNIVSGVAVVSDDTTTIKDKFSAAKTNNQDFVLVDACDSNLTPGEKTAEVRFTKEQSATVLQAVNTYNKGLIIETANGSITIPAADLSKVFSSTEDTRIVIKPSSNDVNPSWIKGDGTTAVNSWQMDIYTVEMYHGQLPLKLKEANLSLNVSFKLNKVRLSETSLKDNPLWAVQFDATEQKNPSVFTRDVKIDESKTNATITLQEFGWYGVARRSFVEGMNLATDTYAVNVYAAKISSPDPEYLLEDQWELLTLKKAVEEEVEPGFSPEQYEYNIETTESKLLFTASETPRIVVGNESPKDFIEGTWSTENESAQWDKTRKVWRLDLENVFTDVKVLIADRTYVFHITRILAPDEKELELTKALQGTVNKYTISNAKPGRKYIVQVKIGKTAGLKDLVSSMFFVVERTGTLESENDAQFYLPKNAPKDTTFWVSLYEVTEGADAMSVIGAPNTDKRYDRQLGDTDVSVLR